MNFRKLLQIWSRIQYACLNIIIQNLFPISDKTGGSLRLITKLRLSLLVFLDISPSFISFTDISLILSYWTVFFWD